MKITLFGFVWFVLIFFCLFKKERMLFALLFSMIFQSTNAIVIGDSIGVGPQVITCFVFAIYVLALNSRSSIKAFKNTIPILSFAVAVTLSLIVNHITNAVSILFLLQLCIYILCFCLIHLFNIQFDKKTVLNYLVFIIWFVAIEGVVQYMMSNLFIPKFEVFRLLFYNEEGAAETVQFLIPYRYPRLFATFMEPSYCGTFLVASLFYLCSDASLFKKNKVLSVILLTEVFLTGSSTAYIALIVGFILFAVFGKNRRLLFRLTPVFVFAAFVGLCMSNYLLEIVTTKLKSSSGLERNKWDRLAIDSFLNNNIFFGIGYKQIRANSILFSILAQTGIFGLFSYFLMIVFVLFFGKKTTGKKRTDCSALVALSVVLVCQMVACPDLDFCVFWFYMFVIGVQLKKGLTCNAARKKTI